MASDITTIYETSKAAVWLQRRNFGSLEFLGCHDITGLTLPDGALSAHRQRTGKGTYAIQSVSRQAADFGSVTIAFYRQIAGLVRDLPCPYNLYIFYANCGADENPNNYDFIDVLKQTYRNGRTQANVVKAIGPDNATDLNAAITVEVATQFLGYTEVKPVTSTEITITAIVAHVINDVSVCDPIADCGDCGDTNGCETIWLVTDGIAGSASVDAAIYRSQDGGATWSAIANPFTDTDDNIISVACSDDTVVLLNGTSSSYAYSNSGGDAVPTWTELTTITQIPNDVFMLGPTNIWIVGAAGYVWYSNQLGANPTTQDAGVATAQNLNSVSFATSRLGYAVGAANAFIYTENGGTNWNARTGPAPAVVLNVVAAVLNTEALFVGDAAGNVFRSKDKGVTWETVFTANTDTSGGIRDIGVEDTNLITFVANNGSGAGTSYRSKDGGQTWEAVTMPSGNTGINALAVCQPNVMFGVGDDGLVFSLKGEDFRDSDPD